MKPDDDWTRWSDAWKRQPAVDVQRLQRRVRRKLWQMRATVAWRWTSGLVAVALVGRVQLMPEVPLPLKVWAALILLLLAALLYFRLRAYRETWHAVSDSVPDLLRVTAKRARAGIRLAWVNIAGTLMMVTGSLLIAAPRLMSSRWQYDPALRQLLISLIVVSAFFLTFNVAFMFRQRRGLRDAEALLAGESDEDTPP